MLKVIQWGTGVTGQHVMRGVCQRDDMQMVGCYTTSDDKHGRDAGELCGLDPIGVTATTDQDAICAMEADCVLYMTLEEFGLDKPVDEVCKLLASGKNVVSTAATALIYPKSCGPEVAERIDAACKKGGTTFHATGIEPGWAGEVLPLTLSPMIKKIDTLLVQEILDYADYPSKAGMVELMKFGCPGEESIPAMPIGAYNAGAFGAPLHMLADAFGANIDDIVFQLDVVNAEEGYDIAAGRIEAGTLAGKRYSFTAMINGEPKLKIEHITRAGKHIAPAWPAGQGWYVTARGQPDFNLSAEIAPEGGVAPVEACLAGAMHVVHSVPVVCRAEAGIKTFLDLPMILGTGLLD